MVLNRWKTACAKLKVAQRSVYSYDTAVSGGGHRRSHYTGEIKCKRNSLFSHWRPLCFQDVLRLVNRLALVLVSVRQALRSLAGIPLQVRLLVQEQGMPATQATSVTSTPLSAPLRGSENFKGMQPMRCVPFCLPKA